MNRLVDELPVGYHIKKVNEIACLGGLQGLAHLEATKKGFLGFRDAVEKKDETIYEGLADDYECIEYAIAHLEQIFQTRSRDNEPTKGKTPACVLAYSLQHIYETLRLTAQEIDERVG